MLAFVKNRLLEKELKRKRSKKNQSELQQNVAFVTTKKHGFKKSENFKSKSYNCGLISYKRSERRKPSKKQSYEYKKQTEGTAGFSEKEEEYCFMTDKGTENKNLNWYLDSGASDHLARTDKYMKNVSTLTNVVKIKSVRSQDNI